MKRFFVAAVLTTCIAAVPVALAADAEFAEKFALSENREEVVRELIPGTEDYYFYHCLHFQNNERFDEVDAMLRTWIERYNRTPRVREIQNRQALFRHASDPRSALEYLRRELGLYFNHQREVEGNRSNLPTSLDPDVIAREPLVRRAFSWHEDTVAGFEDLAFDWLIQLPLEAKPRRDLLQRLTRPDYPNLARLVADDLNTARSGGFGSLGIHNNLLLAQLDELLKLKPELLNQTNFVNVYLARLQPTADTDWRFNDIAREAYSDRLEAFAGRLNDSHNSLKAHILYHRLVHERAQGVYDKARFMRYIGLPRNANYINQDYLRRRENRGVAANLFQDFTAQTRLGVVGDDQPLVRDYLQHFFVDDENYDPYAAYLDDNYLKEVFAETKVVNGLGDMEKWYSWLTPAKYAALRERVDLDFDHANKTLYAPEEPVALDVWVKNVETLIVKVFEINTENYYRRHGRHINTDIDLDGLVANDEQLYTYDLAALRRMKRHYEFPDLTARGVYVIEFIGNGKSSRALVRKGRLHYIVRTGVAGQVFTVLNEAKEKLPDATIWLSGHQYAADEDGTISVPFTNTPGTESIVLTHGSFSYLDEFDHQAEEYRLDAGIHVDRESLRRRRESRVIVRPMLFLNGEPAPVAMIEQPTLTLISTDRDGVSTSRVVEDFELFETRDSVHAFRVPDDLQHLTFTLSGKVENLSRHEKIDLAVSRTFTLNQVDMTERVDMFHLSRMDGRYVLELLDKTGRPLASRPVHFNLKHRDFRDQIDVSLQTDDDGRVALGALDDIDWIKAYDQNGTERVWNPTRDAHTYPSNIHARVGTKVVVPYMGSADSVLRTELGLLEKRGGSYFADRFEALSLEGGYVTIGQLPAGDYELVLKPWRTRINVRLSGGVQSAGYAYSDRRHLQLSSRAPLQIVSVEPRRGEVAIQLANHSAFSRVHVIATRFLPAYDAFASLGEMPIPEPYMRVVPPAESVYVSGRNIGDEYRYILERKYALKFPGNTLERPGLLLNPWAIRKTETEQQVAAPAEAPVASEPPMRAEEFARRAGAAVPSGGFDFANVDFLSGGAVVLLNLEADENGVITIDRDDLDGRQELHVIAIDPRNTVYREVSLPEAELPFQDLRLARGLDPEGHATQQKRITVLEPGDALELENFTTSRIEAYDTLAKVYRLFATLNPNATLTEFEFVTRWPELSEVEKRERYSKYACHELNFFLSKKDPEFFATVVQPYIRNKMDKTFLDHWLAEDDLGDFMEPWAHGQLNIVETILLSERLTGEATATARYVSDRYNMLPPDVDRFNHLFRTAIRGSALEFRGGGVGGLLDKKAESSRFDFAAEEDMFVLNGEFRAEGVSQTDARGALTAAKAMVADEVVLESRKLLPEGAEAEGFRDRFEAGKRDQDRRGRMRQFYQKLDKTQEWAENNYYHLPIEAQNAELITVNGFWRDYATRNPNEPFLSANVAEASRNFSEMLLALALIDLPFTAGEHASELVDERYVVNAVSPMIVYHEEILDAADLGETSPVFVSQNFFRADDRYRYEDNEPIEKFVRDEFLAQVVYGTRVTVTNPDLSRQKLEVLLQVPRGAIPVLNGKYTNSVDVTLESYDTRALEYYFYFPQPGRFVHYPVHVSRNGALVSSAAPQSFNVLLTPSTVDTESWDYISQNGSQEDVIDFLDANNINRVDLDRIAWRMRDKGIFNRVVSLLHARHVYNNTLWAYALYHNELAPMRTFLQHQDGFVGQCGAYIDAPALTLDPVIRKSYQHLEYRPLVNARVHRLGPKRRILNDRFREQYAQLMNVLAYRPALDADDRMSVTHYLLTQDRIEEALAFFRSVDRDALATALQYDYFDAYLAFYTEDLARAREITARYADFGVDRWRKLFAAAAQQLDEIEGARSSAADPASRTQRQEELAATESNFEFAIESREITIRYQNAKRCEINYYVMDLELLFSRNPFVQEYSDHFQTVYPNLTEYITLDQDTGTKAVQLPDQVHNSNVMVEVEIDGKKKSRAYYANTLSVQLVENYGQLTVTHAESGKPLSTVYVKVFARMQDGDVRFYKDGYTDLRGRFDYTSLNTNELDFVEKFSLLILSESDGAIVREAAPPKR